MVTLVPPSRLNESSLVWYAAWRRAGKMQSKPAVIRKQPRRLARGEAGGTWLTGTDVSVTVVLRAKPAWHDDGTAQARA